MNLRKTAIPLSIALAMPVAFTGATQNLLVIVLPIITTLTELKISQLSPVMGIAALAFLVGGYIWPRKAIPGYRHDFLKRLLIAATASQIFFVIALYAGTRDMLSAIFLLIALFVTRFMYGLAGSGVYPIVQAWLINEHSEPGHNRHRALTHLSATVSAARIVVPLLAASLALYRPEAVLALLIVLPLAALLLLPREHIKYPPALSPAPPASRWPEATVAIPTALIHMSLGLTEFIIGPYLSVEWEITLDSTLTYTALLLAGTAVCMILTQFASLRFRPKPELILIWSPVGMACGATVAAIYPAALPAGLVLVAVSLALLLPASAAGAAAGRHQHDQASASADLYTARILGHLLGITAAGPLFEIATNLPLFAAAAIALMAIPAAAKLRQALVTHL